MPQHLRHLVPLALALAFTSAAVAADRATAVTGVVRDGSGVPQMGVLIELLGPGTTLSALTDLQGRYTLRSLTPGIYQLRASATLFAPTLRRHLQVRAGAASVVNLTLSGLFDDTAWLPRRPRLPGESPDDWKWTLRSPANRPMLRLTNDDSAPLDSREASAARERHFGVAAMSQAGGFGASQTELAARVAQRVAGSGDQVFAEAVGFSPNASPAVSASALIGSAEGQATRRRTAVLLRSLPQISAVPTPGSALSSGLFLAEVNSAQRTEIGDFAALEFGGQTELVHAGTSTVLARPFLRLSSSPIEGWVVSYALASTPSVQGFQDVVPSDAALPTVIATPRGLVTDTGLHQEVRLRRNAGRAHVQLSYAHDVQHRTPVSGVLRQPSFASSQDVALEGLMIDNSSGAFRGLAQGFVSDGYSLSIDLPISQAISLWGSYANASGLVQQFTVPARLSVRRGQTVLLATQASLSRTGTRLIATYRLQPAAYVTVLNAYQAADTAPYLGISLRQRLPAALPLPTGTEITVNCTNLLAQGYQASSGAPADAILASALREVRAGLAFSF